MTSLPGYSDDIAAGSVEIDCDHIIGIIIYTTE